MSKKSRAPLPRLKPETMNLMVEAAGFAPACIYESSVEWHEAAVDRWRKRARRARLSAVSPSITSLGLALLLVVL